MFIIDFFKDGYNFIKYTRVLNKIYKDENIIENLNELFGFKFDQDWIGRLYTVINPLVKNGVVDFESIVFDTENGLDKNDTKTYTEKYILKTFAVAEKFVRDKQLFDLLVYRIKKLDNNGNHLLVLEERHWDDFCDSAKKMGKFFVILLLIAIITIFII